MQSFEEFRKSIPFESKRELFSELRNNWRVTDADLRAFIATHGEDAVVFCIYEAVGSGGFDVRIDQWHVLRELLPNHPQIAPLSIRLGLDDGLSADGAEQFARDLLTEKTTSLKDTRFVTESEWAPLMHGARSERVRDVAREARPLHSEILDWVCDQDEVFAYAAWSAIARYPDAVDATSVRSFAFDPRPRIASVQALARLRVEPTEPLQLPLAEPAVRSRFARFFKKSPTPSTWRDGSNVDGDLARFVRDFADAQFPIDWLHPVFVKLSRETFDQMAALVSALDTRTIETWRVTASQEELAGAVKEAQTESDVDALLDSFLSGSLGSFLDDELALNLFEKCSTTGREKLARCFREGRLSRDRTFEKLLARAQNDDDDTFYFDVYRCVIEPEVWLNTAILLATTFDDPTDALVRRHPHACSPHQMLGLAYIGPVVAPYFITSLETCVGTRREWETLRIAIERWPDGASREQTSQVIERMLLAD